MRAVLLVLSTLLLTAGLGLGASSAQAQAQSQPRAHGDPSYGEPAVGECHDYPYPSVSHASDRSPAVDCATTHVDQVIAVVRVPRRVLHQNPDSAFDAFGKECYHALQQTLGGEPTTRALADYNLVWFEPTKGQQRHGARWVRCDVVSFAGHGLAPLPASVQLGQPPFDDSVARCLVGTYPRAYATPCSRHHSYRAAGALKLPHGPYRADRYDRLAQRRCPGIGGRHWVAFWTGEQNWHDGADRVLTCYARTSR